MRTANCFVIFLFLGLLGASLSYGRGSGRGRGSSGSHSSKGYSSGHVSGRSVKVRGYTKKNGKYVAPYHRTAPNKTKTDNYSTKGNVNPYTGKAGSVDPSKK